MLLKIILIKFAWLWKMWHSIKFKNST